MLSSSESNKPAAPASMAHRSTFNAMDWSSNPMDVCELFLVTPTLLTWFQPVSIAMMYFNNFKMRAVLLGLLLSLISACSGGSSGGGNVSNGGSTPPSPSQITSKNVIPVTVDLGQSGNAVNQLFASVTLCQPGSTTQCQTIDHVLVDTGSTGLRVFSAAIPATMNLGRLTGPGGLPLLNCAQFIDTTYAWGPVAAADVVLGGETATSVPQPPVPKH